MIKGFEVETAPLNEYETNKLLPLFLKALLTKTGRANAITSSEITKRLRNSSNVKIDGPRIRKLINHIRIHGLIRGIIATSDGYFIAESEQEIKDYIESLQGRIGAIAAVLKSIIDDRRILYPQVTPEEVHEVKPETAKIEDINNFTIPPDLFPASKS